MKRLILSVVALSICMIFAPMQATATESLKTQGDVDVVLSLQAFEGMAALEGYPYILGAFTPIISGQSVCFLIVISSEVFPFNFLNLPPQSVNGFVLLRSIYAL